MLWGDDVLYCAYNAKNFYNDNRILNLVWNDIFLWRLHCFKLKRKQLRVEEERRRRLKEQEEKERAKDQAAAETAELEQRRQNELLRQKEQVRFAIHFGKLNKAIDEIICWDYKLISRNIANLITLQNLLNLWEKLQPTCCET